MEMGKTWLLWYRCAFSFGFFLLFSYFYKQVLLWVVGGGTVSRQLGPWISESKNLTITQVLHQWGRTNFGPAQSTEPPGHKPLVVNVVVVGPFEEEEEGTGIASDVVKVQGDNLDIPGYLRGDRVRLGRRWSRIVGASPLARSRSLKTINQILLFVLDLWQLRNDTEIVPMVLKRRRRRKIFKSKAVSCKG